MTTYKFPFDVRKANTDDEVNYELLQKIKSTNHVKGRGAIQQSPALTNCNVDARAKIATVYSVH